MLRFIIFVLSVMAIYYGYDNLTMDKSLKNFSIEELEKGNITDRYIRITGGGTTGEFVYKYSKDNPTEATEIIFPLVSKAELEKVVSGEIGQGIIKVIVKKEAKTFNPECILDTTCVDDVITKQANGGYETKGVTLIGLDEIDEETKSLIASSSLKISENVVFLEEGAEPKSGFTSIIMILAGIIGILLSVKSLFSNSKQD